MRLSEWIGCAVVLATVVAGVSGVWAQPAPGQPKYTYTLIDSLSNCYNSGSPALGNNGEAAFIANCDGRPVVRKGDGGMPTDVYAASFGQPYSIPSHVSPSTISDPWHSGADPWAGAAPATRFSWAMAAR